MIVYVGTWSVADSPGGAVWKEAMAWARKLTKYMQSKWPEWGVELLRNHDGAQGEIHWIGRHESIAAREKALSVYQADPGVKALFEELGRAQEAAGSKAFFVSPRDRYFRIVNLD